MGRFRGDRGVHNLPGLNDRSITVIDLDTLEVAGTITTFKDAGYTINHIPVPPEWNRVRGG